MSIMNICNYFFVCDDGSKMKLANGKKSIVEEIWLDEQSDAIQVEIEKFKWINFDENIKTLTFEEKIISNNQINGKIMKVWIQKRSMESSFSKGHICQKYTWTFYVNCN